MRFFSIGQTNDQIPTEITITINNQEDDAASFDGNNSMWGFSKSERKSMRNENGVSSSQAPKTKSRQLHRTATNASNGTSSTASDSSSSSPQQTTSGCVYDYLEEYKKSFQTENAEEVDAFIGAIRDRQRKQRSLIKKAVGNLVDFDP